MTALRLFVAAAGTSVAVAACAGAALEPPPPPSTVEVALPTAPADEPAVQGPPPLATQPAAPQTDAGADLDAATNEAAAKLAAMQGDAAPKEVAEFGMIGLLGMGSNWFDEDGGLGLRGEELGLGGLGTIGDGGGGSGFGGHGRLGGAARRGAGVRQGSATQVAGRLPPEVIQRIVRLHFGPVRACYETGLRTRPDLAGRFSTRFVIGRDGKVGVAKPEVDELQMPSVTECVLRVFRALVFPQPEGGVVTVVYPLIFSPGDAPPSAPPAPPVGDGGAATRGPE